MSKIQSSVLSFTLLLSYLCCNGEARSVREAGISFIFQSFLIHWHSDLKVPCPNLTVGKQSYLQKAHTSHMLMFLKVFKLLIKNMNCYVCP
jgi:hypothetical protein